MTLDELIIKVRRRKDILDSDHFSNDELIDYINDGYLELYDFVVQTEPNAMMDVVTMPISNSIELPLNLYILDRVELVISSNSSKPITNYRILKNKLIMRDDYDSSGYEIEIYYVPTLKRLSEMTDTIINELSQWDEYIINCACIACRVKDEEDTSTLQLRKTELLSRIVSMLEKKYVPRYTTIQDVLGRTSSLSRVRAGRMA